MARNLAFNGYWRTDATILKGILQRQNSFLDTTSQDAYNGMYNLRRQGSVLRVLSIVESTETDEDEAVIVDEPDVTQCYEEVGDCTGMDITVDELTERETDDEVSPLKNNNPHEPMKRKVSMVDKETQTPPKLAKVQDDEIVCHHHSTDNTGMCHFNRSSNMQCFQVQELYVLPNDTSLISENVHIPDSSTNKSNLNDTSVESTNVNCTIINVNSTPLSHEVTPESSIIQVNNDDIINRDIHSEDTVLQEAEVTLTSIVHSDSKDTTSLVINQTNDRNIDSITVSSNSTHTVETNDSKNEEKALDSEHNTEFDLLLQSSKATLVIDEEEKSNIDWDFLRKFWNIRDTNYRVIRARNAKNIPLTLERLVEFSLRHFLKPGDPKCSIKSHIIKAFNSLLELKMYGLIHLKLNDKNFICDIILTEYAISEFYRTRPQTKYLS